MPDERILLGTADIFSKSLEYIEKGCTKGDRGNHDTKLSIHKENGILMDCSKCGLNFLLVIGNII